MAACCLCVCACTVMGYQDKDNKYLPPYNWWADSAAQHLIDVVNKYYQGTGFSFYLSQVRPQLCIGGYQVKQSKAQLA